MESDVIVIGAGVAGLATAVELDNAGLNVLVLEARSRLGGRVFTIRDPALPLPIELGAEFVQADVAQLRKYLGRPSPVQLAGSEWCFEHGKLVACADDWSAVFEALANPGEDEKTFAAFARGAIRTKRWSKRTAELATAYVEGYHAAPADTIGVQSVAVQERASGREGAALGRASQGYDMVVHGLARQLGEKIRRNTVVTGISWNPGRVTVTAQTGRGTDLDDLAASAAVITVPIGVLQASEKKQGAIWFSPSLPRSTANAIRALAMGPVYKIGLQFHQAFWHELNPAFGDLSFVYARTLSFPTLWTNHPIEMPWITAWAGGPAAARLRGKNEDRLVGAALSSIARAFGKPGSFLERQVAAWHVHDWLQDPFSRGGYTYVPVGAMAAQRALAEPVDDTLFFAGEALHDRGAVGTVHGALETGAWAAGRVKHAFA